MNNIKNNKTKIINKVSKNDKNNEPSNINIQNLNNKKNDNNRKFIYKIKNKQYISSDEEKKLYDIPIIIDFAFEGDKYTIKAIYNNNRLKINTIY